ncbi:DUF6695 family protein [Aureitalea marina]|uniref:Uncharacterized protein n=1 Tax=Aureitalea marina TaxID=930804 RepID=A0A2S7KMA4_9FLAO|nr:DUF6695 family protein [Aureitalea marina]PQB03720.1 hypothetical protein BST85_01485 [Aureitalea marina]
MSKTTEIIVLAYPDTFVTMSDEWICKVLPLVGLGTRHYIKAGHAAMLLVDPSRELHYFDFGRYITPKGYGRVRSKETDAELKIPILASYDAHGEITNLDDILLWLDKHPDRTHGEGRLLASVCKAVDHQKACDYILGLQKRGSIPYGAFHKNGSNCSRFVADTLLASTSSGRIRRRLQWNKLFTPSTVGNVEIASSQREMYLVENGEVSSYNGSAFRENLKNYFDKRPKGENNERSLAECAIPLQAQFLDGIGSQAWFYIDPDPLGDDLFRIMRYSSSGQLDYDGVFKSSEFDLSRPYRFTYDSHCGFCHIWQGQKKIRMEGKGSYGQFNSWQSQRAVGM